MFLRFYASEVTLSWFAGGECLPLPASEGPAFPFPLTLDGYPTSPADYAQEQRNSPEKIGDSGDFSMETMLTTPGISWY